MDPAAQFVPSPPVSRASPQSMPDEHEQRCNTKEQCQPENRAVVLCKLMHANDLQILLRHKKQHGGHQPDRCKITWSELDGIEHAGKDFVQHRQSVSGVCTPVLGLGA